MCLTYKSGTPKGRKVTDIDSAERSARARLAAHASWARCSNRAARLANAHAAAEARIARDYGIPEDLPPAEYAVRLANAKRAYFGGLARRSARARRRAAEGRRLDADLVVADDAA